MSVKIENCRKNNTSDSVKDKRLELQSLILSTVLYIFINCDVECAKAYLQEQIGVFAITLLR